MIPTSKLHPPAVDARHVRRDRLVAALTQPGAVRLALVRSPAGFGKSTAMAQARNALRDAGVATAWLTMDTADNDVSRLLAGLHAALDELHPGDHAASVAQSTPPGADAVFAVVERVAWIDFPFVLFVDEFDAIHSPAALAIVGQLIDKLPRGGRVVIGTRALPGLRLARLRAAEQLLEVDASELRFSPDETRAFLEARQARGLSADEIALLHDRTEGWPVAVWLACLALERHDRKGGFIAALSGTEAALANYLAEEVLSQQPASVRSFLLRTSVLAELSVPLCDALLPGQDVKAILRSLVDGGVFLLALEPQSGSWRYHKLVAGFLSAELERESPQEVPALHRAAADAYRRQGRLVRAIEHLIVGGHMDAAVEMLETQAFDLLAQGRVRLLTRWFEALPGEALAARPMLQVAHAWAVSYTKGPQATLLLLDRIRQQVVDGTEVSAHVASIRCSIQVQLDRWDEAYSAGRKWLSSPQAASRFTDAALVNATATAAAVLGMGEEARRLVARAREKQAASHFHRMFCESVEGIVDLQEGRMQQAQARFRLALSTSQAASVHAGYGNAWAGLLYAASVYEVDELAQAKRLLQIYLPFAREAWLPDHTIVGLRLLARIAFHDGDIDEAFERITELEYLGHERQLPRFVAAARLERAWVLMHQGHLGAARTELSLAAESAPWGEIQVRRNLAHDWDDLEIARARLDLISGEGEAARRRLDTLLDQARADCRTRRALKLRLLRAMALAQLREPEAAMRLMTELLNECAREDTVRLFADEGPAAARLLIHVRRGGFAIEPLVADFLQRLLAAFGELDEAEEGSATGLPDPVLKEPLTIKELRLLQLLTEGYSNKALSEKLFVSNSTVRTHLRNINLKLGADSRMQAVAFARRLGLVR